MLLDFGDTCPPNIVAQAQGIKVNSRTGQDLWMDGFVGVSREVDLEGHRCGDGERRIIQFGSGGRPLIMTFMEYVIGKEENVREC